MLDVPFHASNDGQHRAGLYFSYPDRSLPHRVRWRLDLLAPDGRLRAHWQGERALGRRPSTVTVNLAGNWAGNWPGHPRARRRSRPPAGVYRLRLRATARPAGPAGRESPVSIEQSWDLAIGRPARPAMAAFTALPRARHSAAPGDTPAPASLPYTVYLGNLHSQSNHSDGGGALGHCTGAQAPQSAAFGPPDAYAYACAHGLDFLMTSEHNHMYDGAEGGNREADPAAATGLYQRGLREAAAFSAAQPGFLALYGMEWGVISQGGHLNIFNSDLLLGWERNAGGALLADLDTARGDYPALYTLMRERGWIGQFNHPQAGQFLAGGRSLGYTADGDAAMVLCEVMNSNAFSQRSDEGERHLSNYEAACDQALEAGYHLAFSSDQDNHCANWGASYGNRTGVLLPAGTPLSRASFLDALRARRVFATMDKDAQVILTANGHLMGERFSNDGPLRLSVRYASANGRQAAALTLFEGVPGRNGRVAALSHTADTELSPEPGEHFYYARVTQDDGRMLWTAPIWVSQQVSQQASDASAANRALAAKDFR